MRQQVRRRVLQRLSQERGAKRGGGSNRVVQEGGKGRPPDIGGVSEGSQEPRLVCIRLRSCSPPSLQLIKLFRRKEMIGCIMMDR